MQLLSRLEELYSSWWDRRVLWGVTGECFEVWISGRLRSELDCFAVNSENSDSVVWINKLNCSWLNANDCYGQQDQLATEVFNFYAHEGELNNVLLQVNHSIDYFQIYKCYIISLSLSRTIAQNKSTAAKIEMCHSCKNWGWQQMIWNVEWFNDVENC